MQANVAEGLAAFRLTVPDAALMPARRWAEGPTGIGWEDVPTAERDAQARRYAMHFGLALATAAFEASPAIRRVDVAACPLGDGAPPAAPDGRESPASPDAEFPADRQEAALLPGCAHSPGLRGVGLLPQRPRGRPRTAARVLRRRVRPARSRPVRAHAGAALHRAAPGAARAGRRVPAAGRAARARRRRCARPAHRGRGSPPPRGRGAGRPHRARRQRHRGHPHRARGAARRPYPRGRPGGLGLHAPHGGACGGDAGHRGPERRGDVLPRRGPLPGRARPRPRAGPARPRRGGGRAHGRRGRGCRARRLHGRRRDGVPGVRLVRGARTVLPRPASGASEGRR